MTGPTPGPWHKSKTHLGKAYDIGADNGANVALVYGPAEGGPGEFETNADLFIAAPDLLEALKLWKASDEEIDEGACQTLRQIAREKRDAALAAYQPKERDRG